MLRPHHLRFCSYSKKKYYAFAVIIYVLFSLPYIMCQHIDELRPTPVLQLGEKELTTVLLVNNNPHDSFGRFHSLRPEVGLLTSTARTFIQEGVTTEYATQLVGKTLNNGRVYAQYLKKSSRVLYENDPTPAVVTSWVGETTILPQSHNDLYNADHTDWQDLDDRLRKVFVGNTDFVGKIKASESYKMPSVLPQFSSDGTLEISNLKSLALTPILLRSDNIEGDTRNLASQKVLPIADLPTYTVKNEFSSGFSWEYGTPEKRNSPVNRTFSFKDRTPKLYYQELVHPQKQYTEKSPLVTDIFQKRKLTTTTYYGFADFTTIVGDSVIVFSPSSSAQKVNLGQITSIKGEATVETIVPTQVHSSAIVTEHDFKEETSSIVLQKNTLTPYVNQIISTILEGMHSNTNVQETYNSVSLEGNQTLESSSIYNTISTPVLSKPSNEEVLSIFASFVDKEKMLKTPAPDSFTNVISSENTEQSIVSAPNLPSSNLVTSSSNLFTSGGATTIFFEEDPFANFVDDTFTITTTSTTAIIKNELSTTDTINTSSIGAILNNTLTEANEMKKKIFGTEVTPLIDTLVLKTSSIVSSKEEIGYSSVNPTITTSGVIIKELLDNEFDSTYENGCSRTSQVFLTQVPKTVTYFTTYFAPIDNTENEITTSIETKILNTFDILETTKKYCIQPTTVLHMPNLEPTKDLSEKINLPGATDFDEEHTTLQEEIKTTTVSNEEIDYGSGDEALENEDESFEEIELLYKTLYTTYTYLTTIFQESSSSVLSHTEVITHIVSSTIGNIDLINTVLMGALTEIEPTETAISDNKITALNDLESIIHSDEESSGEKDVDVIEFSSLATKLTDLEAKTFHTTYTYFTTIFNEGETEIISRTEVLTNIVTATLTTNSNDVITTPINSTKTSYPDKTSKLDDLLDVINTDSSSSGLNYSTMSRASLSTVNPFIDFQNYSSITLVTDVRSSTSNGERHIIDNVTDNTTPRGILEQPIDDQISSESNTEEIVPSATLLLQTSFTTFTYYTTMYNSDNTNVISRLETITNVVTETLQATRTTDQLEETTLPVTYFTTFTYWTKLAKDGVISTLSREETVSNVITPSNIDFSAAETSIFAPIESSVFHSPTDIFLKETSELSAINTILATKALEPTTYYTTYTYFTTSYESDNTITNSRFETITNVITPTVTLTPDFKDTSEATQINVSPLEEKASQRTSFILYDYKKIIDADGISTLYFMTQVAPSTDSYGVLVQATTSTSSLYIDEVKKALITSPSVQSTINAEGSTVGTRQYKTGLVRLIEGTRIGNDTTTLYQSKVIGTLIDNRYAQIIESTSSFLFEKTNSVASETNIFPSQTTVLFEGTPQHTVGTLEPSLSVIQSSIGDLSDSDQLSDDITVKPNEDDEDDDENQKAPFLSKKRTFTPVIRPFASRNRPQFAPKKKSGLSSSATIITRTDFTPTITATPALKSTNRFSSSRKNSALILSSSGLGLNSSRRFGRPGKISATPSATVSSSFSGRSRFGSSRVISTPGASLKRPLAPQRSSVFGSISNRPAFSSSYGNIPRPRIKPTVSLSLGQHASTTEPLITSLSEAEEDDEEENMTQERINEEEEESTTENARRNQNPLLRFRRPLTSNAVPRGPVATSNLISTKRNPLSARSKSLPTTISTTTTSTTTRPRPRSFQRPLTSSLPGRSRSQSSLFPPRGLFQKQDDPSDGKKSKSDTGINDAQETEDENDYDDDEVEDSENENSDTNQRKRRSNIKKRRQIRTVLSKTALTLNRSKREADITYNPRTNFRNRFRRPKTAVSDEEKSDEENENEKHMPSQPVTRAGRVTSRFSSKYSMGTSLSTTPFVGNHRPIRPTRPTNGRAQFTLREKDISATTKSVQRHSANSFRRPQTTTSSRRTPTAPLGNSRRLKAYSNNNIGSDVSQRSGNTGSRQRTPSRSRTSPTRGRNRNDYNSDAILNTFDGTITVTHYVPSEVTVSVVNGQLTEFKNVITAKTSTEILNPQQYSSFLGPNGHATLVLTREESMTNTAGATEITQFILHDSLTSTVTFTPTTIRGRKTSFSHILPSTIYSVEKLVSTVQPQLGNAPLANILLSQLLLGNIGLPGPAQANPLIGALNQPILTTQTAGSPLTEYRTHTSTYVTTIVEGMSTVVPVTFQGKKILTTVYDTTAQTITATEFITDTIVSTPTQQLSQSGQNVNSLLLQQLLLQQQFQPQLTQDTSVAQLPIKQVFQPESNLQELDANNIQAGIEGIDVPIVEESQFTKTSGRKKSRKSGKSGHRRNKQQEKLNEVESSIITLYVSGRRPGEFSTILSTVQINGDSTLHKRQIDINVQKTITADEKNDFFSAAGSDIISEYHLPDQNVFIKPIWSNKDVIISSQHDTQLSRNFLDSSEYAERTEALETIVGDVSVWFGKSTDLQNRDQTTTPYKTKSRLHFLE